MAHIGDIVVSFMISVEYMYSFNGITDFQEVKVRTGDISFYNLT